MNLKNRLASIIRREPRQPIRPPRLVPSAPPLSPEPGYWPLPTAPDTHPLHLTPSAPPLSPVPSAPRLSPVPGSVGTSTDEKSLAAGIAMSLTAYDSENEANRQREAALHNALAASLVEDQGGEDPLLKQALEESMKVY